MSCPPTDALTLFASLRPTEVDGGDLSQGWSSPQVQEHLKTCVDCSTQVKSWKESLARWQAVDLLDTSEFDEQYFVRLQEEVEASLWSEVKEVATPVVSITQARRSRQRFFALVGSVAAALLLGWLVVQQAPEQPDEPSTLSGLDTQFETAEDIEAEGRDLGRALLASLTTEESETSDLSSAPVWDGRGLLDLDDTELGYFFSNDFHDALDGLDGKDADELIERL